MKRGIIILIIASFITHTKAQESMGIGTDFPDAQSILDIRSTDRGVFLPRMTTGQRNAIGAGATDDGLLIYNISTDAFNYWDGSQWLAFPDADWYEDLTPAGVPDDINDNIYTLGSVGIGLNNPAYELDVSGDARFSGNDIWGGLSGSMYFHSNAGFIFDLEEDLGNSQYFRVRNSLNQILFRVDHSGLTTIDGDVVLESDGNEIRFEGSDPVDIFLNTANPSASMDIGSQGTIDLVLDRDNNNPSSQFRIKRNDGGTNAVNTLFIVPEDHAPNVYPYGTLTGETGGIRFRELATGGTDYIRLRAPDALSGSVNLTLPTTDGAPNELLQTDGTGILSWVDPSSIGGDVDWFLENTTNSPNAITDDIYHSGNVGIGVNNPAAKLDVLHAGPTIIGAQIRYTGTGSGPVALLIEDAGTNTGVHTGSYVLSSGTHNADIDGSRVQITNSGTGAHVGFTASMASGINDKIGFESTLTGTGSGDHHGVYNLLSATGSGDRYGIYNTISGGGTGGKFGLYNFIDDLASGTHYGVYSLVQKAGSFAGFFIGSVGIGTEDLFGTGTPNHYILPPSRGNLDDIMQTDGSGNVSWVDPGLIPDDDWTIGTGTESDHMYPTDLADQVAIGHNSPSAFLDVIGDATTPLAEFRINNAISGTALINEVNSASVINFVMLANQYDNDAGGDLTGLHNLFTGGTGGLGIGNIYGIHNEIDTGPGGVRGIYNEINYTNPAVGSPTPSFGVYNDFVSSPISNGDFYGSYTRIQPTSFDDHYGSYHYLSGDGSGERYGTYNNISSAGIGTRFGVYNDLATSGNGTNFGIMNRLPNTSAQRVAVRNEITGNNGIDAYGIYNLFTGTNIGNKWGNYTLMNGSSAGVIRGTMNDINMANTTETYGTINAVTNTSGTTGFTYGTLNTVNSSATEAVYGVSSILDGTGSGNKYGTYNRITLGAAGSHYAVYGEALTAGANTWAGFFLGDVYVGTSAANGYELPATDGTALQVMQTDGAGNASWVTPTTGDITGVTAGDGLTGGGTAGTVTLNVVAQNGLTVNANDIRLGGTLIQATTINQAANNLTFNMNGAGDFRVQDVGVTHFEVRDNGLTYFGDDTEWHDGSTGGTTLGRFYDSLDDGVFEVYNNGTYNHRIWGAGLSAFNEQGIDVDFKIEGVDLTTLFYVNAGTDRIGINDAAPTAMLHIKQDTGGEEGLAIENDGDTDTWAWEIGTNDLLMSFNGVNVGQYDDVSGNYTALSDQRLKKDVRPLTQSALPGVLKLRPVFYRLHHASDDTQPVFGLIAQEVQELFPELVLETETGYLGLHYSDFGVLAIKAIQEQQVIIDEKEERIDELETTVEDLIRRVASIEAHMN